MIRLAKLTDYGVLVMTRFAVSGAAALQNARDLAGETGLPLPTVSKILKILARSGLLVPHRGAKGGYSLARSPEDITAAELIGTLEGSLGITDCLANDGQSDCMMADGCSMRGHWRLINNTVQQALMQITLADMARPPQRLTQLRAAETQAATETGARASASPPAFDLLAHIPRGDGA